MTRVGIGFDAHAFDSGRPLVLGGVSIPDHAGLSGHSDADVLSHAIADALLGAAAFGDLGGHFPDDDRWKDASSLEILEETVRKLSVAGWMPLNVDATVVAETPRLAPWHDEMVSNVARALSVERSQVSVKASTTDRLGFVGRGDGMAALAIALITRRPSGDQIG